MLQRQRLALTAVAAIFCFIPASLSSSLTETSQLLLRSPISSASGLSARLNIRPALRTGLRLKGGGPAVGRKILDEYTHEIKSNKNDGRQGSIRVEVAKNPDKSIECILTSSIPGQVSLHWGFASRGGGWTAPAAQFLPEGTKKVMAVVLLMRLSAAC
jgi:hypothetical protein